MDRSVELVALDTFLTSLAPDELTGLCPDPVTRGLLTADRLDRVLADPVMDHGAGDNTLALPSLPPECLALITLWYWHWKKQGEDTKAENDANSK